MTSIDFTPIRQRWLRESAKERVRTVRPADTGTDLALARAEIKSLRAERQHDPRREPPGDRPFVST